MSRTHPVPVSPILIPSSPSAPEINNISATPVQPHAKLELFLGVRVCTGQQQLMVESGVNVENEDIIYAEQDINLDENGDQDDEDEEQAATNGFDAPVLDSPYLATLSNRQLVDALNKTCRGFSLTTGSSEPAKNRYYFCCHREGSYLNTRALRDQNRQRSVHTNKINCPYLLRGKVVDEKWGSLGSERTTQSRAVNRLEGPRDEP